MSSPIQLDVIAELLTGSPAHADVVALVQDAERERRCFLQQVIELEADR